MKTQFKNELQLLLLVISALVMIFGNAIFADDINPPSYRGDPLSVHGHWSADATGSLSLDAFSWVDDNDPGTYLHSLPPSILADPGTLGGYQLRLPNFVDELPLKLLRLQLTWEGTTQPPTGVFSQGLDGQNPVLGALTFASTPLVFTQPDGGYQYFDFEYRPNPDFERIHIQLPPDAALVQVVVDSISTVPEPMTLSLLGLGTMICLRKRTRNKKV